MAVLGKKNESLAWWVSRLSERNPMVRPLFLRCCYLFVAIEILDQSNDDLLVVSDSVALLELIAREASKRGWQIQRAGSLPRRFHSLRALLHIASFLRRWMIGPRGNAPRVDGILMRTWIDESSFGPDGAFQDRYFGRLSAWLVSRGLRVTILPVFMNLSRGEAEAWRALEQSGFQFLNPRAFYAVGDLWRAITVCASQRRVRFHDVRIEGFDLTALFEEEARETLFDGGSLDAALSYVLPRRLLERGDRIEIFLDLYENMITEKPLTAAMRSFLPASRVISFQHGIPSPLLVSIFVTEEEAAFAPLPERIVTNGAPFTRMLVEAGMPRERVVDGAALRYEHLTRPAPPGRGNAVLLTLPLAESDAVELLVKAHEALANDESLEVLVKPHPMSDFEMFLRAARIDSLPPRWKVIGGGMGEALRAARVVVTLGSSTAFEAVAGGAMVVVVGRDAALDLNPLQWFPTLDRTVYEPEEILEEVKRLLDMPLNEATKATEMLRGAFNPVNDRTLEAFLPQ